MTQSKMTPATIETTKEDTMKDDTNNHDDSIEAGATAPEAAAPETAGPTSPEKDPKAKKPKQATSEPPSKPPSDAPEVRVLKISECPSLSGRSTLTYHIGCIDEVVQLRVYRNSGKGYFNEEWIAYSRIKMLLAGHEMLTAETLRPIFIGKSVNTAGFFMAVLKHLGLIEASKKNRRCYSYTKSVAFESAAAQLIASGVSITVVQPAAKTHAASKKGMLGLKAKK